jgi:tight adherence protein C
MVLVILASIVLIGIGATLLARAVGAARVRTSLTIENIEAYGFVSDEPAAEIKPTTTIRELVETVADAAGRLVAGRFGREDSVRKDLIAAGIYNLAPRKLMGYRLICALTMPVAWVWFARTSGLDSLLLLGGIVSLALGWMAPLTLVRRRARFRLEDIDRKLPELIDLLVVTVEAGLGLSGALKVAAERLKGPLGDELRLALQEQNFGLATSEVLVNMLGRVETPSMRNFVRSVVQGESLGVSIGQILRNVADDMRKRRRAYAEERAQKAPVKLLFPLVFLIFPAMFLVLLGPAIYSFITALGG